MRIFVWIMRDFILEKKLKFDSILVQTELDSRVSAKLKEGT